MQRDKPEALGRGPVSRAGLLAALPPEWPEDLCPRVRHLAQTSARKVVVLDDDPTGTQTVHSVWVLTRWSKGALVRALADAHPLIYILTNSRSLPRADAVALNREIAARLANAAGELGCDLDVISRSDSTLRGHFPGEVEALRAVLEPALTCRYDGLILCPFFIEGGRLTIGDIHWVTDGEWLVPAAQTEFSRDATFGYTHSDLRQWVEEKTEGRVQASDVWSVSVETIRLSGPEGVRQVLSKARNGRTIVVNAASYRDLSVFVAGLLAAEQAGQRFLFRTAASFVKVRGGVPDRDLLGPGELTSTRSGGGLIAVGSYVERTTRQLLRARELPGLVALELSVPRVLEPSTRETEIQRTAEAACEVITSGQDALVYTSRELLTDLGRAGELAIAKRVSQALVQIVRQMHAVPRFIVAKGGITASDLATGALNVQRAWVLGQILPGVPVWRLEAESRFPGLSYVVFPGNVGTDDSLAKVIRILRG